MKCNVCIYLSVLFSSFCFRVSQLNGDTSADVRTVNAANIIVTTPENWDAVSRRGQQLQAISLLILDQLHFLGKLEF